MRRKYRHWCAVTGIGGIFLIVGIVLYTTPSSDSLTFNEDVVIIDTASNAVTVNVAVADTLAERQDGLMHVRDLPARHGMLFVYGNENRRSFWMKDTYIPLDMLFIAANGTIVDMHTAVPCDSMPCRTYRSAAPAQYVLEVNAGFIQQYNVTLSDRVRLFL